MSLRFNFIIQKLTKFWNIIKNYLYNKNHTYHKKQTYHWGFYKYILLPIYFKKIVKYLSIFNKNKILYLTQAKDSEFIILETIYYTTYEFYQLDNIHNFKYYDKLITIHLLIKFMNEDNEIAIYWKNLDSNIYNNNINIIKTILKELEYLENSYNYFTIIKYKINVYKY